VDLGIMRDAHSLKAVNFLIFIRNFEGVVRADVSQRNGRQHSLWPWQSMFAGRTRCFCLQEQLLPTEGSEAALPVARSLSVEAAKTLVQAFVSSWLDYCNAILHGLPEKLMRRLQSVQNAAARMITSARRRDHITPILRQLHWLPVRQRVDFKIAVLLLVFQCLTGQAPAYLANDCQLAADASARRLRSADTAKCVVRRTYNFGDRYFAAAGPRLWNTLPLNLRLCAIVLDSISDR